jgi:hypothetical protein
VTDGLQLDLQDRVIAVLKADAGVSALVGNRVYDKPKSKPEFPYVTFEDAQELDDTAEQSYEFFEASETRLTLKVWSKEPGFPECKRIARAVKAALHMQPLALTENRQISFSFADAIYRRTDGTISQAVLAFTALTEPT